jgi:hypothetical protein
VLRRRIWIPLVLAGSVGIALAPVSSEAATPSPSAGARSLTGTTQSAAADAAALAKAAGFKTYSTPASKTVRMQKSVAAAIAGHPAARAATASSGTTIYTTSGSTTCTTDTGDGTEANPYCSVQDAVNAASPGDTIDVGSVYSGTGSPGVTITTSDLTIVGTTDASWVTGAPAFTLDGASDVTISNMIMSGGGGGAPAVSIEDSTGITLDSDYLGNREDPSTEVSIDGTSSDITVSRSFLGAIGWQGGLDAVQVAAGARNVDVASNVIDDEPIAATGVEGLDVVGNTILQSCDGAVDIEGASTGVSVENNVFAPIADNDDIGTSEKYCVDNGLGWLPSITVGPSATSGTTSDYNYFNPQPGESDDPYGWGGTDYSTLAAFQAASGEGAHDLEESSTFNGGEIRFPSLQDFPIVPTNETPVVANANTSAPGAVSSDYYGVSPYSTRGAVQFTGPNPDLGISFSVVDSSAFGVTLKYQITGDTQSTFDTPQVSWGDGETGEGFGALTGTVTHSYAQLGTYAITVTFTDGENDYASNSISGVQTAGSEYTAYGPARILDTRKGLGAAEAPAGSDSTLKLKVVGAGTSGDTIPAGITAVVLNVTVVSPTANGVLTVYNDEDQTGAAVTRPGTSNLNFRANQTVPNLVVVPVGANGVVDFYDNSKGSTQVLADVAGYFSENNASEYTSVSPTRILDTRKGVGTGAIAKIPADGSITLTVDGSGDGAIPSSGPAAAVLNLTAVDATGSGVITAYPAGQPLPTVSNLNYSAGRTEANLATVPVGTGGRVVFHNSGSGPVDLIADAFGYYEASTSESAYLPLSAPERILDTRGDGGPIPAGAIGYVPFSPDSDVKSAVLNATVVSPTGNGFLAVYPFNLDTDTAVPTTSNLNYLAGQTVPNLVIVSPGTESDDQGYYDIGLYLGGNGSAQILLDLFGVFEND